MYSADEICRILDFFGREYLCQVYRMYFSSGHLNSNAKE